jgi:PIN domain nuclease of toxin-antitoxin system
MRLLLDTHVWLWTVTTPERLNAAARAMIASSENELVLSAASAWEIAIKHELGKLPLPMSPAQLVESSVRDLGAKVLPITVEHALSAATLPMHHRDPADEAVRVYGGDLLRAD